MPLSIYTSGRIVMVKKCKGGGQSNLCIRLFNKTLGTATDSISGLGFVGAFLNFIVANEGKFSTGCTSNFLGLISPRSIVIGTSFGFSFIDLSVSLGLSS